MEMWGKQWGSTARPPYHPLPWSTSTAPVKWKPSSPVLQLDSREPAEGLFICATKVIRGAVITRPSLCTFSLSLPHALFCSHQPHFPSFTISLSPSSNFFFKPSTLSKSFCWPLLTLRIFSGVVICVYAQEERLNKVERLVFRGEISKIHVLEINPPSFIFQEIAESCGLVYEWQREREREKRRHWSYASVY